MSHRAIRSRQITINITKIKTKIPHLILIAMLVAILWGQMAIGAVGTIIGVTHSLGLCVGVLMPMTLIVVGYVVTVGIRTQVSGPNGVVGSHFMFTMMTGIIPTITNGDKALICVTQITSLVSAIPTIHLTLISSAILGNMAIIACV